MEANGSESPSFETDEDRSYFTVILPVQKKFLVSAEPQPKKKTRKSFEEIKVLILATLEQEGNLSTSELVEAMGYAKINQSVSKAIKELMEEQQIVYLSPDKVRSKNQKLCLVKK